MKRAWSIIQLKQTGKVDSAKFLTENETKSRLKWQFPATPGRSEESPWSRNIAINLWSVLSKENLKACKESAFLNTFYHTIRSYAKRGRKRASVWRSWQMAVSSSASRISAADSVWKIQQWGNFVFLILEEREKKWCCYTSSVEKIRKWKYESPELVLCASIFVLVLPRLPQSVSPSRFSSPLLRLLSFVPSQRRNSVPLLNLSPSLSALINVLTSRKGQDTVEKQTLYPWVCTYTHVLS